MHGNGFDASTRRFAAGVSRRAAGEGLLGLGFAALLPAGAASGKRRKRKGKRRCKVVPQPCSKKRPCCGRLRCQDVPDCDTPEGKYCCAGLGAACGGGSCECCGEAICFGNRCSSRAGDPCSEAGDCCQFAGSPLACAVGTCVLIQP